MSHQPLLALFDPYVGDLRYIAPGLGPLRWFLWPLAGVLFVAGYTCQFLRWLRLLQRENYRGRALASFYRRWAFLTSASAHAVEHSRNITSMVFRTPFQAISTRAAGVGSRVAGEYRVDAHDRQTQRAISLPLVIALLAGVSAATRAYALTFLLVAVYGVVFPWGMPVRGRSRPLEWTRRTRVVAVTATVVIAAITVLLVPTMPLVLVGTIDIVAVPVVLALVAPLARLVGRQVRRAARERGRADLDRVAPSVVVITGTYAKTSVRELLAQFLEGWSGTTFLSRRCDTVEALAALISAELDARTTTLIAELGEGGADVARMVDFLRPRVAVVTGLGPAHLDVLRSTERLESEVLAPLASATTVVVNAADSRVVKVVAAAGRDVASTSRVRIDVVESGAWEVRVDGDVATTVPAMALTYPATVACAASAALALGATRDMVLARLGSLVPSPTDMRSSVVGSGLHVFVDVRDSSPAAAAFATRVLRECAVSGRKVFVTPGVVGLGRSQGYENFRIGALVAQAGAELVAVARTNAEPLIDGFGGPVRRFDTLREAREWVRSTLGADDAVMYFNDLPDHYP